MATKSSTLEIILEILNDVGETPACTLTPSPVLTLSSWLKRSDLRFTLDNAATDQALGITEELIAVVIYSHDYPFSARLKTGEKLLTNGRLFVWWGDDELESAYDGTADDILLTGNTDNDSDIQAVLITKP